MQPRRADQRQMLHIALAPAAVAGCEVEQVGRALLVGALQIGGQVHGPAAPAQQGAFQGVVAHHLPAERLGARQDRQGAGLGEGARAHDRVVAPVAAFRTRPPGQAGPGHATVQAGCELQGAGEYGLAVDDHRHGLDQANVRVALHRISHPDHSVAGHQAVGVKHDHAFVACAMTAHPVGDVAGLAARVIPAQAVVH